jgi:hypothetical protein
MKWIKTRQKFLLEEAKIKDVIFPKQAKQVTRQWGEKWLNLEEIEATDNIEQGRWKLSEEDKMRALGEFLQCDLEGVYEVFKNLPEKFVDAINKSIDLSLFRDDIENWTKLLDNFDMRKPSINQIGALTDSIFRKISVGETKASEMVLRGEDGRPIMGEDGRPQKVKKEPGDIIYSKNLVNINSFIDDYNQCFDEKVDASRFTTGEIPRLVGNSKQDFGGNNYKVDIDIYGRDLHLSIKHNPKDILNISISRFYSSCQHLYSGGWRDRVIGNVFDPNSIPAFLVFDAQIYDRDGDLISEQLPLTRLFVRNIESFDTKKEKQLYFDRAYPDRMWDTLKDIIEKYTSNKHTDASGYLFTPDLPYGLEDDINEPYMDRLRLNKGKYIGINADKIYLNHSYDWSRTIISPKANIKEIVIETENVPKNFFDIQLKPDWIKLKFIKINTLKNFKNLNTDSFAFDKCKFDGKILKDLANNNIKKISIEACDITNLKLSELGQMDEICLIYTLDPSELIKTLEGVNCKKLVISGDLLSEKSNKDFINTLKRNGVKVEIVGLVI